MLERLTADGYTEEDLQNPEKVKEIAEKFEAENKENSADTPENKILSDQLGRMEKAFLKGRKPTEKSEPSPDTTPSELSVEDRVFARMEKLNENQLEVLKEYSQLSKNKGKSFEEIASTSAVQAEFKELQATADASDELDTNASEDKLLESKNEIYENHSKTGKEPESEYERKVIVEKGLQDAGFRTY